MKVPADTTCIVEIWVEVEDEDSFEQMDNKISSSFVDEAILPDFEEVHPGEFMELDDDGVLVPLEEGVYKCKVAYLAGISKYVLLTQDKLSNDEAEACYRSI